MRLKQTVIKTRCHWVAPRGLWEAQAVCLEMGPVRFSEGRVTAMPSGYSAGNSNVALLLDRNVRAQQSAVLEKLIYAIGCAGKPCKGEVNVEKRR